MSVFKIDGNVEIDANKVYINGEQADLSVIKLSNADYERIVRNGSCDEKTLYVIDDEFLNAFNMQLKNVKAPTDDNDAATKRYVDEHSATSAEGIKAIEAIVKDILKRTKLTVE